jgi:predicted amidohydrolase
MLLKPSRIALAQISSILGNVDRNIERHVEWAERAIAQGARAIIFPELSLTGYTVRDLNFDCANPLDSSSYDPLRAISTRISIICGTIEEDERGAVYNAALLFEDGQVKHSHRKVYPPTYGIFEEGRYFTSGRAVEAFNSERLGRMGMLVCEDLWHPALPYVLAIDGAQLIVTIAASPTRLGTGEIQNHDPVEPENYIINREHHAAYARLFGCYIMFVNRVGVEEGVNFWGGSEIVAPSGETIARGAFFEEDLIVADIDPEQVRQARQRSRHFLDDDPTLTQRLLARVLGTDIVSADEREILFDLLERK